MKTLHSLSMRFLITTLFLFGIQGAQAASLGLTTYEPDIAVSGATVDYSYTAMCTSGNGGAGVAVCGTVTGNGGNQKTWNVASEADSYGLLNITGSGNFLTTMDPSGTVYGFLTGGSYSLSADFNGDGSFAGGSLDITYAGTFDLSGQGFGPGFTSGTAVSADLLDFGFSGTGAAGAYEFTFNNVSGDFLAFMGVNGIGGTIATSFNMTGIAGDWDANMNFQSDYAGTANVDTFVPVPAAVWLFGSGLIGLVGFARSRRRVQ